MYTPRLPSGWTITTGSCGAARFFMPRRFRAAARWRLSHAVLGQPEVSCSLPDGSPRDSIGSVLAEPIDAGERSIGAITTVVELACEVCNRVSFPMFAYLHQNIGNAVYLAGGV